MVYEKYDAHIFALEGIGVTGARAVGALDIVQLSILRRLIFSGGFLPSKGLLGEVSTKLRLMYDCGTYHLQCHIVCMSNPGAV